MTGRLRTLTSRLSDQDGQAIVLAIAIVVVGMLLGLGAVAYALNANGASVHDERGRGSQQAADTGVQQQLYLQSDSAALGYNLSGGGVLGAGALVGCVLGSASASVSGTVNGYLDASGQCVPNSTGGSNCTTCQPVWTPVDNEDYDQSEFWSNSQAQSSGGPSNTLAIQFPEIVSLGCHTTTQPSGTSTTTLTAPVTACNGASRANSYSRQLAILEPAGPLQAAEAGNDATIWGSSTLVYSTLYPLQTNPLVAVVTGGALGTAGVNLLCADPTLVALLGTISASISVDGLTISGVEDVCSLVRNATAGQIGVVDGNISAGHDLYVPANVVAANSAGTGTSGSLAGVAGAVATVLTSATNVLTNLSNVTSTLEYGDDTGSDTGDYCSLYQAGTNPPSSSYCSPQTASTPVTSAGVSFVQAGAGACVAGQPSTDCTLQRPTFSIATAPLTVLPSTITSVGAAPTLGGTAGTSSFGVLTIPAASTVTFNAGTYVFCGIYALGKIATSTTGGGVQIFILAPGSQGCSSATASGSSPPAGSFVACQGLGNQLTGLGVDGVTNVVNPSGFQVYVQGDSSYSGDTEGVDTPIGTVNASAGTLSPKCPYTITPTPSYSQPPVPDPDTQVYVGNTSSTTQAYIIYAPASQVTVNTTTVLEGSVIGWNVDLSASAVIQDLDLGNYPLSSVVNAYQLARDEQCNGSAAPLAYQQSADLAGC